MSQEEKARELIRQAEEKQKSGWFTSAKFDEAAELYSNAANCLKMVKKSKSEVQLLRLLWSDHGSLIGIYIDVQAGKLYENAALCSLKVNYFFEAASNYAKAASCYRKEDNNRLFPFVPFFFSFRTQAPK